MQWSRKLDDLIKDWYYFYRRRGRPVYKSFFKSLTRRLYRHITLSIFAVPLSQSVPTPNPKIPLDIHEFRQEDLEAVSKIIRLSEVKLIVKRLDRGHIGVIAYHENQPIAYQWACTEIDPTIDKIHVVPKPGEVYYAYAYTIPSYRRKGLQLPMGLKLAEILKNMGYKKFVTMINIQNTPSLSLWKKLVGTDELGYVELYKIGPIRWMRTTMFDND